MKVKVTVSMLVLLIATIFLGFSGIFPKLIVLPADSIILGRSIVAVLLFLPIILLSKASIRLAGKKNIYLVAVIGLLMAGHWVFFYHSIKLSTVAIAVILIFTYPMMSAIIEPLWNKKKVNNNTKGSNFINSISTILRIFSDKFKILDINCENLFKSETY